MNIHSVPETLKQHHPDESVSPAPSAHSLSAEQLTADLARLEKTYWSLLHEGNNTEADRLCGEIENILQAELPLLYQDAVIAIYGKGKTSACLLSFIERFAAHRKSKIVFLHTYDYTGSRFRSYPVYNVSEIDRVRPDRIVIASVRFADSIRETLKQHGALKYPTTAVPENISLLLKNYEENAGKIKAPEKIAAKQPEQSCRPEPFYMNSPGWQELTILLSFPALRESAAGIYCPSGECFTLPGLPIKRDMDKDDERICSASEALVRYLQAWEPVVFTPTSIRIESSTLCQLDCVGCYMRLSGGGAMGAGFIRAAQVKKLLEMNPSVRDVELSNNGEPFMNPEFRDILDCLHRRKITVRLNNGTNFNDVPDDVLKALVTCPVQDITIALDGVTQDVYRQYRRHGDIEKVYENIRKLNHFKAEAGSLFPRLRWQFVLMDHNQHEAAAAVRKAGELGMQISFRPDWRGTFVPEDPETLSAVTGLSFSNQKEYAAKEGHVFGSNYICTQMILSPQINWDGRILGCCNVFRSDWGMNAFDMPLSELFNNSSYRAAVISLLRGKDGMDHTGPCRNCLIYNENVINNRYPLYMGF